MMLSKIAASCGGRRRCISSVHARIPRNLSAGTLDAFRIEKSASKKLFRATALSSDASVPFAGSIRPFSTTEDTRPSKRTTHHTPFNNRGKQQSFSQHEVQNLMDESKGMLTLQKSMDASHREIKLQQLLLSWRPVIKHLNDDQHTLRQAVKYADSLANIYLDISMEANADSSRSNTNASTFVNPAIHGWAKIQRNDPHSGAAIEAENLLKRLMDLYESTGDYFFRPRLHTFNGVLDAFSKSASKDAPYKARQWLNRMINDSNCVSPDRISLNSVMNAYASRGNAMGATALFEDMREQKSRGLQPDTYSYNMLMKAWQRSASPKASSATFRLLKEFKKAYKRQGKENLFLTPNTSIYSIPMSLANAEKAHSLLDDMLDWYQREPQSGMQPKTWHYEMVMNAYAKERQPEQAENIFMRMLLLNREGHNHVHPSVKSFCILINAWCKQCTPEATARAEAILEQMEELFLDVGVSTGERMNTYGYNAGRLVLC